MCSWLLPPVTTGLGCRASFDAKKSLHLSLYTRRYLLPSIPHVSINTIAQDVEFDFNVQHDCLFAGCGPTGKRPRVQERIVASEATETFIEHRDISRWIINTHSLHNGHLLRRCLPQD